MSKPATLSSSLLGVPKGEATPHRTDDPPAVPTPLPEPPAPSSQLAKATKRPAPSLTVQPRRRPVLTPLLVRIEQDTHERLKAYSFRTKIPVQEIVNDLAKQFLDGQGA
jgi:hypothetical protein